MSPRVIAGASSDQTPTTADAKSASFDTNALMCSSNPPRLFENTMFLKHKRRYCRKEGCNRIVKSQGLCQRHGAKPRTCKVEGCTKQAQGNFDRMCKAHFKAMKRKTTPIPKVENTDEPPPAQGFSVYDEILPNSLNFASDNNTDTRKLPLIVHLKDGFDTLKPPAWHRNEERRARGMFPIDNPAAQLEGWERELVWMEILVLTGVPGASFRHLARAWGRDKGFHMVLAQFICERHGDVERKKRHGEKNANKIGDNSGTCDNKKKRRKTTAKAKSTQKNVKDFDNNGGNTEYNNEDVGADVWDPSLYGDVDTNEALAAEIFDFTEKEFERVVSKYKQGISSDVSVSTSTTNTGRNTSSSSTDIAAQAAMTAILGQQQQQRTSSITGQGQVHHRSNSMLSSTSNGSSKTNGQEHVIPTPVQVDATATVMHHSTTTNQRQMVPMLGQHNSSGKSPIESSSTHESVDDAQGYHSHLTPLQGDVMYTISQQQQMQPQRMRPPQIQPQQMQPQQIQPQQMQPQQMQPQQIQPHQMQPRQMQPRQMQPQQMQPQQMQPQQMQPQQMQPQPQPQQIFKDKSQVQNPPIQVFDHTYRQQQKQQHLLNSRENQVQEKIPHQTIQQPTRYNEHASAQSSHEMQTDTQAQAPVQPETQAVSRQISTTLQTTQNSESETQHFPHSISYALSPEERQQQHHTLASMSASQEPSNISQSQAPLVEQQHQHQHQQIHQRLNPQSFPEHKDHSNSAAPNGSVNTSSYEQQQHKLQRYETVVAANSPPEQPNAASNHAVHTPVQQNQRCGQQHQELQQQHQLRYAQKKFVPEAAPVQLAPLAHSQHQIPFPHNGHQQIHAQVHAQCQNSASPSLSQVSEQQIAYPSYPPPPQQHGREHLNQLMDHSTHETPAQDPLDVHHEMHATQQDQKNL